MRLLFIKLKHIGDALLMTPAIAAAKQRHPDAEIWVVVRRGCEGILAGCPAIDRIVTTAAPESSRRGAGDWLSGPRLVGRLRQQRFDWAFELSDGDRGRWLAWLSGAPQRAATRVYTRVNWLARRAITRFSDTDWLGGHRAEKDHLLVRECLGLEGPAPSLQFARERTEPWSAGIPSTDYAVLHPGTRWIRKRWHLDRWIEVGRQLRARGLALVISCGPDEEERDTARRIGAALGPETISTDGAARWAQLAGLLYGARLFVGVDTAAMHLAAACNCPTVALFGPSTVRFWRPWRVEHRVVLSPGSAAAQEAPDYLQQVPQQSCEGISVAAVLEACDALLPTRVAGT
jgi:heptosyltransferase-3